MQETASSNQQQFAAAVLVLVASVIVGKANCHTSLRRQLATGHWPLATEHRHAPSQKRCSPADAVDGALSVQCTVRRTSHPVASLVQQATVLSDCLPACQNVHFMSVNQSKRQFSYAVMAARQQTASKRCLEKNVGDCERCHRKQHHQHEHQGALSTCMYAVLQRFLNVH